MMTNVQTCRYMFPLHPQEMFNKTPRNMDESTRMMRLEIIKHISELSQTYSQFDLNNKLYMDVDSDNNIIGLDMSNLVEININMCLGRRVNLGTLKAVDWINMKIM